MSKAIPPLLALTAALAAAFPAQAATLGAFAPQAEIGSALRWQIPLQGNDLPLDASCVRVSATQGDSGLRISHSVTGNVLTIRSLGPVQEPVVNVRISLGCPTTFDRTLVALADPPGSARAAPAVAAPAPVAAAPSAPAVATTIAQAEASAATAAAPAVTPAPARLPRVPSAELPALAQVPTPARNVPPATPERSAQEAPRTSVLDAPASTPSPVAVSPDALLAAQLRTADEAIARALGRAVPSASRSASAAPPRRAAESRATAPRRSTASVTRKRPAAPPSRPSRALAAASAASAATSADLDDTLPLTAGVPRSPQVGDRLRLDDIQHGLTLDDQWVEPTANATTTAGQASEQILFGQDAAASEARILQLEKEVGDLRSQVAQGGSGSAGAPAASAGTPASDDSSWMTWALAAGGGLLALLLALAVMRRRKGQTKDAGSDAAQSLAPRTAAKTPLQPWETAPETALPVAAPEPPTPAVAPAPEAAPASFFEELDEPAAAPAVAAAAPEPDNADLLLDEEWAQPPSDELTAHFHYDDLVDLQQQTEFFAAFEDDDKAVALLGESVKGRAARCPIVYGHLLELLQRQGDEATYAQVSERYRRLFGAAAPAFGQPVLDGPGLETYPELLQPVEDAAAQPQEAMALLDGILFPTSPELSSLTLPAYCDALARYGELHTRWTEQGGLTSPAASLPFADDALQSRATSSPVEAATAAAPAAAVAMAAAATAAAAAGAAAALASPSAPAEAAAGSDDDDQADSPLAEFQRLFGAEPEAESGAEASEEATAHSAHDASSDDLDIDLDDGADAPSADLSVAQVAAPPAPEGWPQTPQQAQSLPVFEGAAEGDEELLSAFSEAWDAAESVPPDEHGGDITDFTPIPDLPATPTPAQTETPEDVLDAGDLDLDFDLDDLALEEPAAAPAPAAESPDVLADLEAELDSMALSPAGAPEPAADEAVDVDFDALLGDMALDDSPAVASPAPAPAAATAAAAKSDDLDFDFDDLLALSEDGAKASQTPAAAAPAPADPADDFASLLRSNSGKKF
ncbi:hypothetical protein [Amphibiibacter pelophylacis]|uniref:Uncharacterized protein n=1 Tax=Amphibiibacter pelophylacis TaxID=1799477 RepID=A0ACC6P1B6_9BURK